jgi:hypothetical protein
VSNPHSIPRLQADPDQLDFDGLRRRGIALLQELSGKQWTDYNYHDPGVTLLELLCYGITDLVYRTDFDVADFLCDEQGNINFQAQALYPPQSIFPNLAVTDLDYCKLIYDHLPDVEDVWISSNKNPHSFAGLLTVFVKPHQSLTNRNQKASSELCEDLRAQVIELLSAQRSLGRDLATIHIVQPKMFRLAGEIEIDDRRACAEVYADIYFRCAKLVSSGSQIMRFEEALRKGLDWEQLFTGPLTERGFIDEASFLDGSYDIDVVKLITLVRHIPGVKNVRSLVLVDDEGQLHEHLQFNHSDPNCPTLQFPSDAQQIHALNLIQGNTALVSINSNPIDEDKLAARLNNNYLKHDSQREIHAFHEQVSLHLKKYEFEYEAFRRNRSDFHKLIELPKPSARDFAQYRSIGEDTPAIYGINHFGVPKSEPAEVHARARQLKAYLYPFEQLMANYLASLQQVRQIYSINPQLDRSYFSQFLDEQQIPAIRSVYQKSATPQEVAKILREQDAFEDRRNRVLDTLLAMYGEQFPSEEFRRNDCYHHNRVEHQLIRCKIQLLEHLCELSSQRGNASNLQQAWSHNNLSSLQKRLRILTGSAAATAGYHSPSLIQGLQEKFQFISDSRYRALLEKQISFPSELRTSQLNAIPKQLPTDEEQRSDYEFTFPHSAICESLLKYGVDWKNYQSLPSGEHHVWLCLRVSNHQNIGTQVEQYWPICLLPKSELEVFLSNLTEALIQISLSIEGFHLVEHILFRPHRDTHQREVESTFYSHRISVILPGFTARFAENKARIWVENLIAQHLPAHLMPEFFWLDFAFLAQFEKRYQEWSKAMQEYTINAYQGDATLLDQCADQIIAFLNKNRPTQPNRYWI